jgi:hypothetical protein
MHDHNYTLKFQQKRWWQFVEERSNGSLEDQITTVNVPLLVRLAIGHLFLLH